MAYIDFPKTFQGNKERKAFWMSADGLELISQWRREGRPLDEIAMRYIGVTEGTMVRWRKESPDMERAIRQTDDLVNAQVERTLLQRALGYDAVDVEEELVEGELRVTRRTTRHVPPDTKAALSWLFSRRSDRWRAQQAPLDSSREELQAVRDVVVSIAEAAKVEALPIEVESRVEEVPERAARHPGDTGV